MAACPEHSAPPPDLDAIEALVESAAPVVRRICVERTDLAALVAAVRHANTRAKTLETALDETQAALRTVAERVIDRREFPAVVAKSREICDRATTLLGEEAE